MFSACDCRGTYQNSLAKFNLQIHNSGTSRYLNSRPRYKLDVAVGVTVTQSLKDMAVDGCANFSRKQLPDLGALPVHLTAVALHGATLLGLCCGIFESWSVFFGQRPGSGESHQNLPKFEPFHRPKSVPCAPLSGRRFWRSDGVFFSKFDRTDDVLQVFYGQIV